MSEPGLLGVSEQPPTSNEHHPVGPQAAGEHLPVHVLLTSGTSGWGRLLTATEQGDDLHRQVLELLIRFAGKFCAGSSNCQHLLGVTQV